jgi:Short C-terminal domain
MKPLTRDDLRMNEQAIAVATKVVREQVEAAARCHQVTEDMKLEAAGVGSINRGFIRASKAMSRAMMPRTMGGLNQMETGGLPDAFVLAVTPDKVYAIEDKQDDGSLVPGKVLKTWDRATFTAKPSSSHGLAVQGGVPDDRQLLIIYLPIEGGKSRYMQAAGRQTAAFGSPGMPHRLALGKDDASNQLIQAVSANAPIPGANVMVGGQSLAEMMAQAQARMAQAGITPSGMTDMSGMTGAAAQPDPVEQLTKLADLHDRGVLTDEEFAAEKAKILGS